MLSETILEIRKKGDLTQEDFAEKLFVTRQAVSRWENGETTPGIDTLKRISELFNVDANAFFGTAACCQSCSMQLKKFDDYAVNIDGGVNTDYCHYCYVDGAFAMDGTVEDMIEVNLQYLKEFNAENGTNFTEEQARKILKMHLPTLKRWKKT